MHFRPTTHHTCHQLPSEVTLLRLHLDDRPKCKSYTAFTNRSQHSHALSTRYTRHTRLVCQASSGTLSKPKRDYLSNSFANQDIFLIAGAGIAGLAMAAALTKVGIPCRVLEREAGPRKEGSAIGLWPNAFRALDALGVADVLRQQHPLITRVELCGSSGDVLKNFGLDECDGGPHEFRGVKRSTLLEALQKVVPSECIQYSASIHTVETDQNGAIVTLDDGNKVRARCVIGADGGNSRTARALKVPQPKYAGYTAYRGVAVMPQGLPIPRDTVRQCWGQGVRAGMYPLSDTELYWFTVFNAPKDSAFVPQKDRVADALRFVEGWQGGIQEAIRNTSESNISRSKLTDRWPGLGKGYSSGAVTLAGDAAHPMTPNLGQGGCTALEDAVVLARMLRDTLRPSDLSNGDRPHTLRSLLTPDLVQVLRQYEKERKARTRLITIRSNLMGQALQIPFAPVCAFRNAVVKNVYSPRHFLDHATFDCGSLE